MTVHIALLLALMQTNFFLPPRLELSAPFQAPLNTVASSWVVLDVGTGLEGTIQSIAILQGANPFVNIAVSSVRQWTFSPASTFQPMESHVTVVFLFRPRDLFSSSPV